MMKEQSAKKKIIIMGVITFLAVAVLLAALFGGAGERISRGDAVTVYDSEGGKIAVVRLDDGKFETELINTDAGEYVNVAMNEALAEYGEISGEKDDPALFFENVRVVKTNLRADVLRKIKDGYDSSEIDRTASFASVVTDLEGRVLAAYGKGSEDGVIYTVKGTYAGSSIKPLSVYAPAIGSGKVHWSTMILDSPVKNVVNGDGKEVEWPANANGSYTNKEMLICDAVEKSINTVAVRVLRELSVEKAVDFLSNNFSLKLDYEKKLMKTEGSDEILGNIALGYLYDGISALEMAGCYQIFANGGCYTDPYTVTSIEGEKGVIYTAEPEKVKVISPQTASVMTQLLRGVVYPGGTGSEAFLENAEVAGKSGTSDSYADNWFVGFTPEYICSVWHSGDADRKNKASSTFALIMENMPVETKRFTVNKDVQLKFYCRKTGLLRGDGCIDTDSGYYLSANTPGICRECKK